MNPIILALDCDSLLEADSILDKTKDFIGMIKIGPQLFNSFHKEALSLGPKYHLPIFLDLKLHDIPNTVAKTVKVISDLCLQYKIKFLTIHAFGGSQMMKEAVKEAQNLQLVAVTLLTSLNYSDLRSFGFSDTRDNIKTIELAKLAKSEGINAFVSSPQNAKLLRKHQPNSTIICPGIRNDQSKDDQKRTSSIEFAIKSGADYVVIGRPITQDPDPEFMAKCFLDQAEKT